VNATRFEIRGANPGDVKVRSNASSGHIDLAVNGGACSARLPLSTIEYERSDRGYVGLQAGGRFSRPASGEASAVVVPPSFTVDNGTIDVTTHNLTGHIDDSEVQIVKNTTHSRNQTRSLDDRLLTGDSACKRPDNVTVTVRSRYYRAWARHLEAETGVVATTYASNDTARVYLDQSWLPRRANDSANHVVNMSDDSVASVTSDGAPTSAPSYTFSTTTDDLQVDKGAGNNYTAIALPLGNGTQSSYIEQVPGDTVYRRPIDIVFVIDESGSMGDLASDGTMTKMEAAQRAAKNFVTEINTSTDRVAFVDSESTYHRIDGSNTYFTNDTSAANDTIDTYDDGGNTAINLGLDKGNAVHDFRERPESQKVVILLSDGENTVGTDSATVEQAERAAENNVTVFTVGFGDGADEDLLEQVANETGGTYRFAENATELNTVFQDILSNITSVSAIAHRPTTARLSIGGDRIQPKLGYSNPDINRINGSYDINDPRYRGGFEFSASAADGNLVNVTAVSYECENRAKQLTDVYVTNDTTGKTYRRARCTDVDNSSKEVVSPDEVEIFLDGAAVSELPDDDESWYQADLVNDTLAPYISGGTLDLRSNEAVIVFRYTVDGESSQIVMLYQIGLSEGRSVVDVFDLRVTTAHAGD
jgi:Mg-chelatase subunit ChlD